MAQFGRAGARISVSTVGQGAEYGEPNRPAASVYMCSPHTQLRLDNANAGRQFAPRAANAFGFVDKSANESISPPNEKRRVALKSSSVCMAEAAEENPGAVEVVRAGLMEFSLRLRESAFRHWFRKQIALPHW